jgi:hypothetical protein
MIWPGAHIFSLLYTHTYADRYGVTLITPFHISRFLLWPFSCFFALNLLMSCGRRLTWWGVSRLFLFSFFMRHSGTWSLVGYSFCFLRILYFVYFVICVLRLLDVRLE